MCTNSLGEVRFRALQHRLQLPDADARLPQAIVRLQEPLSRSTRRSRRLKDSRTASTTPIKTCYLICDACYYVDSA